MEMPPWPEEERSTATPQLTFQSEDISFQLEHADLVKQWIAAIIKSYHHQLSYINYIFCSDAYLHKINVEYLQHDTLTDIITFPYAESPIVESDIFISIDRVTENAKSFDVSFEQELYRVVIHGVLHLCGLRDKTPEEAKAMRLAEEKSLQLLRQLKTS
jgi:probable rRNA maturation factor